MGDPIDLNHFVEAQDRDGTYALAAAELRAGRKTTHWMWFVFPQITGLGQSPMSKRYAITSLGEARDYLCHGVLGPRLNECTRVVTNLTGRSAGEIFGEVDAMKFRSSMTLFAMASPQSTLFQDVLDTYFDGARDPKTEQLGTTPRSAKTRRS